MASRGSRLDWLIFLALGFFWGSSYLFIKIGVDHGLQPFTLIMFRLADRLRPARAVVAVAREPLPRDPRTYGHLFVMGVDQHRDPVQPDHVRRADGRLVARRRSSTAPSRSS